MRTMAALHFAFPAQHSTPEAERGCICGTSDMARVVRQHDWSRTPLGPIAGWSETLIAAVNLVLSSPVPSTLYWGPELLMIYNDGYRLIVGSRHPRALGRPGSEVWSEAWHIVGPQFEETLLTGEAVQDDSMLVPIEHDGAVQDFYWNYSISPVYEAGRIAGLYNTCTNVTAAVLTAWERDGLGQRLEQVLSSTSDGVATIDRDWRVTYMNRAACRAMAAIPGMVGRNLWRSLPALDDGGSQKAHFQRAMDENVPSEFESYYPEPLNRWLCMRVSPMPEGVAVFFQDITEEKQSREEAARAGAALAASEEELRWTVELSAQMPWTANVNGAILSFDHRGSEADGRTIERSKGTNWHRLIHAEDLERSKAAWECSLRTGEPYDVEQRVMTKAGEYRWFRSRAYPRWDDDGRLVKWYGTTEDIEVRRQTEQALRTSEKLAVVGRLATTIAHEINNPLEAVTNLLYLARTGDALSEETQGYLDAADRELRRASAITSQTLRFQRQSSKPTEVQLRDLVDEVVSLMRGRLLNSSVTLELRMLAAKPVRCIEGEIRQVLLNLTTNAIDAMHGSGGGRLMIRTRIATEWKSGRRGVVLTVADSGPGMPVQVQAMIFNPFFTTKGHAGTGLGLWVSQEIVGRHGGSLRLRSRDGSQGSGSVFTLFLPEEAAAAEMPLDERRLGAVERRQAESEWVSTPAAASGI